MCESEDQYPSPFFTRAIQLLHSYTIQLHSPQPYSHLLQLLSAPHDYLITIDFLPTLFFTPTVDWVLRYSPGCQTLQCLSIVTLYTSFKRNHACCVISNEFSHALYCFDCAHLLPRRSWTMFIEGYWLF